LKQTIIKLKKKKQDAMIFLYSLMTAGRVSHGSLVALLQCQVELNNFKNVSLLYLSFFQVSFVDISLKYMRTLHAQMRNKQMPQYLY